MRLRCPSVQSFGFPPVFGLSRDSISLHLQIISSAFFPSKFVFASPLYFSAFAFWRNSLLDPFNQNSNLQFEPRKCVPTLRWALNAPPTLHYVSSCNSWSHFLASITPPHPPGVSKGHRGLISLTSCNLEAIFLFTSHPPKTPPLLPSSAASSGAIKVSSASLPHAGEGVRLRRRVR